MIATTSILSGTCAMTSQNQSIKLELELRSDHPDLLVGLDFWLQLGLLSEAQLEGIGRRSLSCPLPIVASEQTSEQTSDFLPPVLSASASPQPTQPSWLAQLLTSFMAEISVVWLLFLGVFLVVVSSGVLAASQWQNFPPVGQYGILWGYTLAFGLAGLWAGQRLQMTGQMLRLATLLIIPVNFWMIDGFGLWRSGVGGMVGAIASLSLALVTLRFLRQSPRLTQFNQLALCGLHWGWGVPGLALVAAYGATIGTAGLQVWQQREDEEQPSSGIDLGRVAIACSLLLLVGRALLAQKIPVSDLGLAFGICGWLLSWMNRQQQRPLWTPIGIGLLFVGWAVTVTSDHLWQALGISILGLWLLVDQLRRSWGTQVLVALSLVGLQTYALLRVIFPPSFRSGVISWIATQAGLELGAWELTGLGFFGYSLILLGGSAYLRRSQQPGLARLTDRFALILGLILFIPSCVNPLVRAVYLSLSTVTLGVLVSRRSPSLSLIYLTHIAGLLTLFSWISWSVPGLSIYGWSFVLLGVTIAEWIFCEIDSSEGWKTSAVMLGAGITVVNLLLLTNRVTAAVFSQNLAATWEIPLVSGLIAGAIGFKLLRGSFRQYSQGTNAGFLGIAWAIELLVSSLIQGLNGSWEQWAIVNLALGLLIQLGGDWWQRSGERHFWKSLHVIPVIYAGLGVSVAHLTLTATTGLYTLAAALTFIGVGRRAPEFKPLTYLGIAGVSIALYERLIYQLLQASGGAIGDGLVLLALPAAAIAILYKLCDRWLLTYWRLADSELQAFAQLHWLGGAGLVSLAILSELSSFGSSLVVFVLVLLTGYALWVGQSQPQWIYAGAAAASVAIGYGLYRLLPEAMVLGWGGVIAALLAIAFYKLPWSRWGWMPAPWRRSAKVLPGLIVLLTSYSITIPTLFIVAAFYAWIAHVSRQVRLSYIGLFLVDWGIFRIFIERSLSHPLWYITVVSISILYTVQIDPALQSSTARNTRHLLRCLAVGLVGLTALYQSGTSWSQGLFIIGLSLGFIGAGLFLRIRAFLFIGTLLFLIQVLRQLWFFIADYSLMLWGLGIALGVALIWVAATFEARRSQAIDLMQYWAAELDRWE
jgi:hypothetical protein